MTDFLTFTDVLAIHEDQIERYGGAHGIRDPGLLEAALFRPQTGYYDDIFSQAAALWESMAQNHPFIDGNKRAAFACTLTFLAINGIAINASSDKIYEFIASLYAQNDFSFNKLRGWLQSNTAHIN
jgi:death-on-curing protein